MATEPISEKQRGERAPHEKSGVVTVRHSSSTHPRTERAGKATGKTSGETTDSASVRNTAQTAAVKQKTGTGVPNSADSSQSVNKGALSQGHPNQERPHRKRRSGKNSSGHRDRKMNEGSEFTAGASKTGKEIEKDRDRDREKDRDRDRGKEKNRDKKDYRAKGTGRREKTDQQSAKSSEHVTHDREKGDYPVSAAAKEGVRDSHGKVGSHETHSRDGGRESAVKSIGVGAASKDTIKEPFRDRLKDGAATQQHSKGYGRNADAPHSRGHGGGSGRGRYSSPDSLVKAEETIDDVKADILRIEKEIELEIKEIQSLKLVL